MTQTATTKKIENKLQHLNWTMNVKHQEATTEKEHRFYQTSIDKQLAWFQGQGITLTFSNGQYAIATAQGAEQTETVESIIEEIVVVNNQYIRESVGMSGDECIAALAKVRAQREV